MTTPLPPSSDFVGSSVTEGGFKSAITALRDFLSGLLGTDGTLATALATLGTIFCATSGKTTTYAVVFGDRGKVINCTSGTWTLSLLAAATAGDGFSVGVRNSGAGVLTIDPSLTETIDGAATLDLAAGESALLVCTGSAWLTFGYAATIDFSPYKKLTDVTAGTQYGGVSVGTNSAATSYTKMISCRALVTGTVRVRYWHSNSGGETTYTKIYKNGVVAGSEHTTTSSSLVEVTEDLSVVAGDILQLYAKATSGSYFASMRGLNLGVVAIGTCGETATGSLISTTGLE